MASTCGFSAISGGETITLSTGKLAEHEWPKLNQAVGRLAQ